MQEREFWQLLEEVFGRSYGRALAQDQQLTRLDDMTVVEALHAGLEPRVVWNVLCDQMDIPDSKRWGRDHNAPPMPAKWDCRRIRAAWFVHSLAYGALCRATRRNGRGMIGVSWPTAK